MSLSFRERFEQAVLTPAASRDYFGSPVQLELRWEAEFTNTIDAIKALRDSGLSLHGAKQRIEELMATHFLVVTLPAVADLAALIDRLGKAGATARIVAPALPPSCYRE